MVDEMDEKGEFISFIYTPYKMRKQWKLVFDVDEIRMIW